MARGVGGQLKSSNANSYSVCLLGSKGRNPIYHRVRSDVVVLHRQTGPMVLAAPEENWTRVVCVCVRDPLFSSSSNGETIEPPTVKRRRIDGTTLTRDFASFFFFDRPTTRSRFSAGIHAEPVNTSLDLVEWDWL